MEAIDWIKPIELMDGTQLENGWGSIHGILIPGKAPNGGFHTDLQGCIGGVQVVRNRKEPVKIPVWIRFADLPLAHTVYTYLVPVEDADAVQVLVWRDENGKTCVEVCMSDDRISKERDAIKATIAYMDARIGAVTRLLDAEREEVASRNNDVAEREVKLARVEKERDALKAKLEHADTRIRRLETCVEDFLKLTEVPDANCSCHLNPPCGDCVEYGGIRDVRGLANALLKERGV